MAPRARSFVATPPVANRCLIIDWFLCNKNRPLGKVVLINWKTKNIFLRKLLYLNQLPLSSAFIYAKEMMKVQSLRFVISASLLLWLIVRFAEQRNYWEAL